MKSELRNIIKKIIIIIKIFILIIFIIFFKNYTFKTYNNNHKIYYSYIKYNIYNRLKRKKILKNIKLGVYTVSLENGGRERLTALLINYLFKEKIFDIFLFTNMDKNPNEYKIPDKVKRIKIFGIENFKNELIQKNIDIIIYQDYDLDYIKMLNDLKNVKTIFYNHCCFLYLIYNNLITFFKRFYNLYQNAKYIISLIPFENDYLFKKWGITSILMNNFITYNYDEIIPSNLSSRIIIMVGRANDKNKRFDLGIKAMKYIIDEIPDCKMIIISSLDGTSYLMDLVKELDLSNNIKFVGYTLSPEEYYKNASLHIFPSLIECFPMILSETKLYGIPNIIAGIDYVSAAKGGVININDDSPQKIAKEAIKILSNENYRKNLGKNARISMKKFNNKIILKKWVELILAVYNGDYFYNKLRNESQKLPEKEAINQLENQLVNMKKRIENMPNITLIDLLKIDFIDKFRNN